MGKIAFLFSGQGDQKIGMGTSLIEASPAARQIFAAADATLPYSVTELCQNGPIERLNQTLYTQGCVLAVDLTAAAALTEAGIRPDGVAGFSLGEVAALAFAGVFSLEDAFSVIRSRAAHMQDACQDSPGGMAACIGASAEAVHELCGELGGVWAVNLNCPGQTVIAGGTEALARFIATAKEKKIRAIPLAVSGAFHTELLAPAAKAFFADLGSVATQSASIPVYGNTFAAEYPNNPEKIRQILADQMQKPVLWEQTIRNMAEDGYDTFIECGPGGTLTGFFKRMGLTGVRAIAVNDQQSLRAVLDTGGTDAES